MRLGVTRMGSDTKIEIHNAEIYIQKYKRAREKKTRDKRFKVVRQRAYIHTLSPLGYILHLLNNFIVNRRPPCIGAK
jgi:hypothetical protein